MSAETEPTRDLLLKLCPDEKVVDAIWEMKGPVESSIVVFYGYCLNHPGSNPPELQELREKLLYLDKHDSWKSAS